MITEQLNNIIKKYNIEQTKNIIYGTNIPMPNAVVPTPWKAYVKFEEAEFYSDKEENEITDEELRILNIKDK